MVRWDVVCLVISNIFSNSCYSLVVPFLPLELETWGISVSIIGYIFCMYSVAVILGSPIVGRLMTTIGRKKILIFGLCFMGLAMIGFGVIPYSNSVFMFLVLAFFFRFCQGIASCSIQTTSYSIVSMNFPDEQEKYIALIETAVGVGLILGPVFGSALYSLYGFSMTFFVIGAVFLALTPILYILIPNSIDMQDQVETDAEKTIHEFEEHQTLEDKDTKVSFCKLLGTRRFIIAALGGMMANFMYCYMEPVLAFRIKEFNIANSPLGMIFFSIQPISYILVSFSISWFTKTYANRGLIMLGALLCSFSMLLVGPSHALPNSLILMGLGQLCIGGFGLFLMVPVIPEMINSGSRYYPTKIIELTDISAGVFNSGLGIGQVAGPIFGSYVTQFTDFRTCSDIVGYILFTYALLYFLLGDGLVLMKTLCKDPQTKKRLDVVRDSPARNVHMRNRLLSNASHDENFDLDSSKLHQRMTPLLSKSQREEV